MVEQKVEQEVSQEVSQEVEQNGGRQASNNHALALVPLRKELEQYLNLQLAMPWTEQRQFLTSTVSINESGVKKVVSMAQTYKLPLDVFALIPTKQGLKPYVKANGIVFRLQMDHRGILSIVPEILHWATVEEPWAYVRCTIKFKDGSEFVAHASHSTDSEGNLKSTPDYITMKCETKAVRRCGEKAVGIPFPVYESEMEYKSWESGQVIEGEVIELGVVNNIAEFLSKLMTDYDVQPMELPGRLGLKSMDEVEPFVFAKLNVERWGEIKDLDKAVVSLGLSSDLKEASSEEASE